MASIQILDLVSPASEELSIGDLSQVQGGVALATGSISYKLYPSLTSGSKLPLPGATGIGGVAFVRG